MADPSDLVDYIEKAINIISKNLRKPRERILDLPPNNPMRATIVIPLFTLGPKR